MQTYLETQESLSVLLERARAEGEVRIKRADGEVFVLKPEKAKRSAFDVAGINLGVSNKEIVEFVREGRERLKMRVENNGQHSKSMGVRANQLFSYERCLFRSRCMTVVSPHATQPLDLSGNGLPC